MKFCTFPRVLGVVCLFAGLFWSGRLYAQPHTFYKGDTIKVITADYMVRRLIGTAIDIKGDTLTIQVAGRVFPIPLHKIRRLEVARGKKRNTKKVPSLERFPGDWDWDLDYLLLSLYRMKGLDHLEVKLY